MDVQVMNDFRFASERHAVSLPVTRGLRKVIGGTCGLVVVIALLAFVGWWSGVHALVGSFSGPATMKPNTALVLLLLAVATLCKQDKERLGTAANVLCVCAIAVAAVTLAEYMTGQSFGIDQLLAAVPAEPFGDPPGRMSRGTAIDGLLSGLALLLLDVDPAWEVAFATMASLLSMSALVGYLFDAGPLMGVPVLRSMAARTAASFFGLQLCFFLLRPWREPTRSLLHSARHHRAGGFFVVGTCTLPLLIGLPVALLYRRGVLATTFSFAVLVVALIAAQAFLVSKNSRSLTQVEDKRDHVERERERLAVQNERQHATLVESEARLARSEAQYRLITDALPALVSYLDRDLRYVRMNRTYQDWFGLQACEMQGKLLDEVLGKSTVEVRRHLRAALSGAPQQFETQIQTLQGERTVSISHIPDIDGSGFVRGVIVQANDVTAKKQAEAALRQTEKLAAVGKLASSIAHEINNPLEAVTNLLYLAGTSTDVQEIQEFLGTAEEELRRVSAIANQTLLFHKQTTNPVVISPVNLLDSVLKIYRGRLRNGKVVLEERHRRAEPVACLDGEIRQVLNNLVGNAIDAMQGRTGRLYLRSRTATDWKTGRRGMVIVVADTGAGMSAKTLESIFEPFFTTKGMSGTGLGLWVSKEIVSRHEGVLSVRSSQAKDRSGTMFRLFLPSMGQYAFVQDIAGQGRLV